jgi:hypothetical protein
MQELIVAQLTKKLLIFYGNEIFIAVNKTFSGDQLRQFGATTEHCSCVPHIDNLGLS